MAQITLDGALRGASHASMADDDLSFEFEAQLEQPPSNALPSAPGQGAAPSGYTGAGADTVSARMTARSVLTARLWGTCGMCCCLRGTRTRCARRGCAAPASTTLAVPVCSQRQLDLAVLPTEMLGQQLATFRKNFKKVRGGGRGRRRRHLSHPTPTALTPPACRLLLLPRRPCAPTGSEACA